MHRAVMLEQVVLLFISCYILINKLNAMRSELFPIFLSLSVVYMLQVVYYLFQIFFCTCWRETIAFTMSD